MILCFVICNLASVALFKYSLSNMNQPQEVQRVLRHIIYPTESHQTKLRIPVKKAPPAGTDQPWFVVIHLVGSQLHSENGTHSY